MPKMLNKNFAPQRLDPGQTHSDQFFNKYPEDLAIALLGKVLRRRVTTSEGSFWLAARIIETEAYYITEKGSHSSLGFTEKRKAMFMNPGTIYMYYARGGDSLNFSARGKGNGVLVKSAYPHLDSTSPPLTLDIMRSNHTSPREDRAKEKLCNGQTLLCKSLNLKVPEWNQQHLKHNELRLEGLGEAPGSIIKCRRIGIPEGRDHDLMLRFVEEKYSRFCTSNPLTKRKWAEGIDYKLLTPNQQD
jgi:DNA-3-methyladenine glycosylase